MSRVSLAFKTIRNGSSSAAQALCPTSVNIRYPWYLAVVYAAQNNRIVSIRKDWFPLTQNVLDNSKSYKIFFL